MHPKTRPRSQSLPNIPPLFSASSRQAAPQQPVPPVQASAPRETVFNDGEPLVELDTHNNIERYLRIASGLPPDQADIYMAGALLRLIPQARNDTEMHTIRSLISDTMLESYPVLNKALNEWYANADT